MPTVLNELFFVVRTNPDPSGTATIFGIYENINRANDNILEFDKDPTTSGLYAVATTASGVGGSGLLSGDVINIINSPTVINNIASGVASLIRFDLPLIADDDDVNHATVSDLPVAEYDDSQKSRWNLKTPVGGISGIVFDFSYFTENSETAAINFDLSVRELPVGVDVSSLTPLVATISESATFTSEIIRNNEVKLGINILGLQDISLSFERVSDSLNGKVRAVSYGIIYKGSGLA